VARCGWGRDLQNYYAVARRGCRRDLQGEKFMGRIAVGRMLMAISGLAILVGASGQDRMQGRSVVMSRGGIVAAENPLAAQAGATILAHGGNAIDAAVATNAAMGVVAPMMNGIGGDLFAIVYDAKSDKLYGLNASGWAPAGLTIEFLKSKNITKMPVVGIQSVTVPGTVDGWSKLLERFGRKTMAEDLAPAIHFARTGFPVTERTAVDWDEYTKVLQDDANATKTFLPGGKAPAAGEIFRNPDLAASLQAVGKLGRDGFYRGEIARAIVETSRTLGGTMTMRDLEEFSSDWVEPISTTYRDWTVYEIPPNGQGIAALEMLNLMERFPMAQFGAGSADALHTMIEAKKLAYADLLRYIGDPKFSEINVGGILSKEYAKERARRIDAKQANCAVVAGTPPPAGGDTTYLTVVDGEGNMVSLIQSNYAGFGSGVVATGTGFALQDRGGLFNLEAGTPNALAGHKRPLHTIIPGFMTRGDEKIAFGIMGGFNQAQAHAQFVANVADFGMNIQAAIEAPRFTKYTFDGCDVAMEDRVAEAARAELASRGHQISLRHGYSSYFGGGQAVMRNYGTRVNFGASDPRKDGAAIPEATASP
jgi:gamma-glutamyltranspeptidase/glutathione hydrolase